MDYEKMAKHVFAYMTKQPYGTDISTFEAVRRVFPDLKGVHRGPEIGWVYVCAEHEFTHDDFFKIDIIIKGLFEHSETHFQDPSRSVGTYCGYPFNTGSEIRSYDGLITEFSKVRRRKCQEGITIRKMKYKELRSERLLITIAPGKRVTISDLMPLELLWGQIVNGSGEYIDGPISKGESICEGTFGQPIPENWQIVNSSSDDMTVYIVKRL